MYTCIHVYIYTYIHIYIYTYVHVYIYNKIFKFMFVMHAVCRYTCVGKMLMNPSCSGPCWTFPPASTLAACVLQPLLPAKDLESLALTCQGTPLWEVEINQMDQNYQQFQKLTHHKLLLFLPILCQYVGLGIPQLYVETIWAWKSSMLKNGYSKVKNNC